jgi:hypothetical protein
VGIGWKDLVAEAYGHLLDGATVWQVKEKFGGLRFYYSDVVEHEAIGEIEEKSFTICESCGESGVPRTIRHWVVTMCDACDAEC